MTDLLFADASSAPGPLWPPCDTCGEDLVALDHEAWTPEEAWALAAKGELLCTPCAEGEG